MPGPMNEAQTIQSEQAADPAVAPGNDAPIVFLGIGVVINLVLVTAYFVWARKQWKKTARRED